MQNLKTIKCHSLKAHMDRLQDTAEALAQLGAGETIAGRLFSSHEMARLSVGLLAVKAATERAAEAVRGEAADTQLTGKRVCSSCGHEFDLV